MMLNVLLIDDNPNDRLLAIRELKQEFPDLEVITVIDAQQFDRVLLTGNFDLAVVDYQLCWTDGLTAFQAIRSHYPDCPVVMFTDSGSEEVAVEGLKAGLCDYVLKSQHYRRLAIAVRDSLEKQRWRQEQSQYLEQQQINAERLRLAVLASGLGTWDWDSTTGKIIWDAEHEQLFGLPNGSFGGTYEAFLACVHPEDRDSITEAINHSLETKTDYKHEYRIIWSDGSLRWIAERGNYIYNESGEPIRMMGVVMDITERKQLEVQLAQQAEELSQANRLKDEFLAIVSHELRTPLNAILGWTQLMLKRDFDPVKRNNSLQTIERNALQQKRLIEDILDVSRLMRGQIELQIVQVDLAKIIENEVDTLLVSAESKSIHLESNLDTASIQGDERRLQQIIWNLLSNAIKFTPKGGQVTVQLQKINNDAHITISDTGQGISPNFLPYVFERFRQADSSSTRSHNGLGLGLSIVRHLVELHGGTVKAESLGIGKGATFTVCLPLAVVRENTSVSHSSHEF